MIKKGPITGTFIDEITYDIPSSNWSREQWKKDLDYMQEIGIDTVIFIRGGLGNRSIFPSKVLGTPYEDDFAGFIFEETSKRNMKVIFGLYISNINWNGGDDETEYRINKPFIDEVVSRYGDYPSFYGWYIPHETCCRHNNFEKIVLNMSKMCKDKTPEKKVLISPFFKSHICAPKTFMTPKEHYEEWDALFDYAGKDVDFCAFQDGSAYMEDMEEFFIYTEKVCKKHNIEHWVNVETFERDVRKMYYPIPFGVLKRKLDMHAKYADKMITFEFSHFLSPQSIYPSAHNLNNLYKEYYLK